MCVPPISRISGLASRAKERPPLVPTPSHSTFQGLIPLPSPHLSSIHGETAFVTPFEDSEHLEFSHLKDIPESDCCGRG
jgi:hypothetical protein